MTRSKILIGDSFRVLRTLPAESVHCVVTSPPYWGLRDYGVPGQLGLEKTPEEHTEAMVGIFREVRRVLRADGTCWVNYGDCYATGTNALRPERTTTEGAQVPASWASRCQTVRRHPPGLKPKDLVGMPWRVAFALQADGWYLRSDIIWHKPNPMPESVTDRPTKAHEYIFLLSKNPRYYYDADAVREEHKEESLDRYKHRFTRDKTSGDGHVMSDAYQTIHGHPSGRNKRTVWTVATEAYSEAHFATFPKKLIEPCILAGSPEGGTVLDPFCGSGTTGLVANRHGRRFLGIELNSEYAEMARRRVRDDAPLFNDVDVKEHVE